MWLRTLVPNKENEEKKRQVEVWVGILECIMVWRISKLLMDNFSKFPVRVESRNVESPEGVGPFFVVKPVKTCVMWNWYWIKKRPDSLVWVTSIAPTYLYHLLTFGGRTEKVPFDSVSPRNPVYDVLVCRCPNLHHGPGQTSGPVGEVKQSGRLTLGDGWWSPLRTSEHERRGCG